MADYTHIKLEQVPDMAPRFGMEGLEARFARRALETSRTGMTHFRYHAGARTPFGHKHAGQEEVYVLIGGSARIKVGDDVVELEPLDAIRVDGDAMRAFEAGPEGADILAFGESTDAETETEMVPGWWSG